MRLWSFKPEKFIRKSCPPSALGHPGFFDHRPEHEGYHLPRRGGAGFCHSLAYSGGGHLRAGTGPDGIHSTSASCPLREAISASVHKHFKVGYDPVREILIGVGVSEAMDLAFRAIITPATR